MIDKIVQKVKQALLNEITGTDGSRGSYISPLVPGTREFEKSKLAPFYDPVSEYNSALLSYDSYDGKMSYPKDVIKKIEKKAKKISDKIRKNPNLIDQDDEGGLINRNGINEWVEINEDTVVEDLGVWFGTKKKPKGSSQPKGPWVNICRKVNGKHPPCGRSEATDKAYPKCRAAGVAGKMSDSEKRAACQQKRKAEKTHPKSGTGNSPKMVSYKPRKK